MVPAWKDYGHDKEAWTMQHSMHTHTLFVPMYT